MTAPRRALLVGVLVTMAAGAAAAAIEQVYIDPQPSLSDIAANLPYDGRLTFVRVSYQYGLGGFRRREPPWMHDYPTSDTHMMKILNELTLARPHLDGSNIYALSDPALHNYPIAYMSEPGFWMMEEEDVKGLRSYLLKGGMIIFDDFRGRDFDNLQEQMRRALPELHWIEIDPTQPVFHSFFEIDDPHSMIPPYGNMPPVFYGLFEQNDPAKRLMAVANVNNDLGEYWEFSDTGYAPVDLSNEAYKFGVNYYIYGLTH